MIYDSKIVKHFCYTYYYALESKLYIATFFFQNRSNSLTRKVFHVVIILATLSNLNAFSFLLLQTNFDCTDA